MRSFLFLLMFGLLFSTACGSGSNSEATGDAGETEAPAETATVSMDGDGYTITVLNADIPSPRKEMKANINGVDVVINYGSPSVKGREIWGGLVPYGKVWRTGANEATSIEFSDNVTINGQPLPAGKYGLFTLPNEGEVTVIFNQVSEMWGSGDYDETKDALRVNVTPRPTAESAEAMDFVVEGNDIILHWEKLAVPFTVAPQG